MTDFGQSTTELRQRAERGYSTVLIAANSVNQAGDAQGGPWVFLGFQKTTYPYGTWWGAVLAYTPAQIIAPGSTPSKVVAVAAGDHCQDCASRALEIVEWVRKALEVLPGYLNRDLSTGAVIDKGMVTFAFTQSGATGLDAVIIELQAAFGTSNVPIIVSWRDANGQLCWQCIGSAEACRIARENGYARRAACNQHGQPSSCGAQEATSLPSQSAPQQDPGQTSSSEGLSIGPVDPPPLPACSNTACLTPL